MKREGRVQVFSSKLLNFMIYWEDHKLKTGTHLELSLRSAIYKDLGLGPQRRDSLGEY